MGHQHSMPAEKQIEVAGALVDGSSVRELAAALEAHTIECIANRHGKYPSPRQDRVIYIWNNDG